MSALRLLCIPALFVATGAFAQPANVWLKRLNLTSSSGDRILATQKVGSDSMVVATARYASANLDPFGGFVTLTRLDGAGSVVWTRDYFLPGGAYTSVAFMTANATGDLAFVTKPTLTTAIETPDAVVHKFRGSDGAPMWTSRLTASQMSSAVAGALFDSAGNLLIGGNSKDSGGECFRVVKVNGTNGATMWVGTGRAVGLGSYHASSMAVDSQGNVAIVGSAKEDYCGYEQWALSVRFSGATGAMTWNRTFTLDGVGSVAVDCAFDSTNALVVAINPRDANNKVNPTLIKYAGATGNEAWTRTITPVGNDIWTVEDLEIGPGNMVFLTGDWSQGAAGTSVYVGKWAANGGQQFLLRYPLATGKTLVTQPASMKIDTAGNPVVAMIETGSMNSKPTPYFAKMNGTSGAQIWYRRSGVTGFTTPVFRSFQLFANGAFSAALTHVGKSAVLRYQNTIPAQPSWTYQPTAATVSRDDTATHFVQNPAGDIFVAGASNDRWHISKYNSAGTRLFAVTNPGTNPLTSTHVRQIALAPDGNLLVAGRLTLTDYITKFNATTGAKMWETPAGGYYTGAGPSVFAVNADGIYVTYYNKVRKLDQAGALVWTGTFTPPSGHIARPNAITFASDGNPVIAGDLQPQTALCDEVPNYRIIAAKFDKTTGAISWTYTSSPSVMGLHTLNGLQAAADGSIFLASVVPGTAPVVSRSCLTKLNASGVQQYESFYAPAGHGSTPELAMTLDGNNPILVQAAVPATNVGRETVVIRYNGATGAQTYATKDTGNNTSAIRPASLFANATGVYAFGWRITPTQGREAVILKLNAAGVKQWTYAYAGTATGSNNMSWAAPAATGTNLVWVGSSTGTNSGYDQVIGRITNP